MEIDLREAAAGIVVISVGGTIDAFAADALLGALSGQVRQGNTRLVADLNAVSHTGSAGLRALLIVLKDTRREGGDLRLSAVQSDVLRVLELSGLTSVLQLYPDVESAVASFQTSKPAPIGGR